MNESTLVSQHMQEIMEEIDNRLEGIAGTRLGFTLLVFTDEYTNYASNLSQSDCLLLLAKLVEQLEEGTLDTPAHKIN